jgi:hypothetical protein
MQDEQKQCDGDSIMKSKLTRRVPTSATIIALILGIAAMARAADPPNATNPPTALATTITVDPNTGLPIPPQWIDPNWKCPDQVLPDVNFDMPLTEVARRLRDTFKDAFDVILPNSCDWHPTDQTSTFDPSATVMKLQLKNVTATEVFNAMNMVFESENAPLRWELKMNGTRPLALLRVVPALFPQPAAAPPGAPSLPPVENKRMVFFVGDLVGDEKSGGMTMQQLFDTVCKVYDMGMGYDPGNGSSPSRSDIKFHKEAQLLVVNSPADRIDFVQNTLAALRQKEQMTERTAAGSKTKPEAPKKAEAAPEPNK